MKIIRQRMTVLSNECLAPGIYSIWLENRSMAMLAKPGQFISLYSKDSAHLLPRPISICEIDKEKAAIRIVFRVAGFGTDEFAHLAPKETLDAIGPLGNGYDMSGKGTSLLVGGGIGIPPMLELAKQLPGEKTVVLGYRDSLCFLAKEFEPYARVLIATEDGSVGVKGFVTDCIKKNNIKADMVYSCGPIPMLKGVAAIAEELSVPAQVSLEERMACGIGACLGCITKTKEKDSHSNVNNKRICTEGPVFLASELNW